MGEVTSAWNVACLRLEDFLRVHRVQDREHLLRLNIEILDAAHRAHAEHPERSPLDVTMEIASSRTEAWFALLADARATPDAQLAARGRAAWFASGLHREWPAAFLAPNPPVELLSAVRAASMQAGPAMEFSSLSRAEVDYGPMEDIVEGTWQQFSWTHVLRAFVIWLFIFFAAYGAWLTYFAK